MVSPFKPLSGATRAAEWFQSRESSSMADCLPPSSLVVDISSSLELSFGGFFLSIDSKTIDEETHRQTEGK